MNKLQNHLVQSNICWGKSKLKVEWGCEYVHFWDSVNGCVFEMGKICHTSHLHLELLFWKIFFCLKHNEQVVRRQGCQMNNTHTRGNKKRKFFECALQSYNLILSPILAELQPQQFTFINTAWNLEMYCFDTIR